MKTFLEHKYKCIDVIHREREREREIVREKTKIGSVE